MNREQIHELLTSIERALNRKFRYHNTIAWLYETSSLRNMSDVFEDVLFLSKFLSHAYAVLQREGVASDSTQNLKHEFTATLEKLHSLLRTLIKEAQEPERGEFIAQFLQTKPECLEQILALAKELTWIKNYYLDQAKQ